MGHVQNCTCFTSADPEGGTGDPDPPPPGKSQVIWVSIGNKQMIGPPPLWKKLDPPGKCWIPSGTLKMIDFFSIDHLTSVNKLRTKK